MLVLNRENKRNQAKISISIAAFNPFPAHFSATPTRTSITTEWSDPLQAFFALYAPFEYNRLASSHDEFKRLCAFYAWPPFYVEPNHEERREAWKSFRIAMVKAFNMTFGQDERDIEAWGRMCVLVDMENIPEGLEARRLVNATSPPLVGVILSSIFKSLITP